MRGVAESRSPGLNICCQWGIEKLKGQRPAAGCAPALFNKPGACGSRTFEFEVRSSPLAMV
jgi:hypothetical protein